MLIRVLLQPVPCDKTHPCPHLPLVIYISRQYTGPRYDFPKKRQVWNKISQQENLKKHTDFNPRKKNLGTTIMLALFLSTGTRFELEILQSLY